MELALGELGRGLALAVSTNPALNVIICLDFSPAGVLVGCSTSRRRQGDGTDSEPKTRLLYMLMSEVPPSLHRRSSPRPQSAFISCQAAEQHHAVATPLHPSILSDSPRLERKVHDSTSTVSACQGRAGTGSLTARWAVLATA